MCGFVASFGKKLDYESLDKALSKLKRRGPDSKGTWSEDSVFLGSRRLAIFDLNERSNQPMTSISQRYVLVFNGAIYNYKSLRDFLIKNGVILKTYSDTEVILELFALEGKKMLHRLEGMFAFVIWDKESKEAFAARDAYGIKPLYFELSSDGIILSSQVKAILSTNQIIYEKDIYSDFSFNNFGYVIEPNTWFKKIKSLEAGNYIVIKKGKITEKKKWFNLEKLWVIADSEKIINELDCISPIKKAIMDSVKKHLVADVPVGIFLSGGIDSALLASLISKNFKKNITAITILFEDFENSSNDETLQAKKIADELGIKHHIFRVTQAEFRTDLPKIFEAMDQPSIDGVNVWYASKAASNLNLKVIFSGLGGDEIFFGYDHYKKIPMFLNILNFSKKIPALTLILKLILKLIGFFKKDSRWKSIIKNSNSIFNLWFLKRSVSKSNIETLNKESDLNEFYSQFINKELNLEFKNSKIKLSQLDSIFYMRNQLLRDSDWASMYHGVELRTPFVDTKLIEKLSPLMTSYSFYKNKEVLKECFKNELSAELFLRKKKGFQTPIKNWYKSYFKDNIISNRNFIHHYMNDIKFHFKKISNDK